MDGEMAKLKWKYHNMLEKLNFITAETMLNMEHTRELMGGKLEELRTPLFEKEPKRLFLKPIKYRLKESEKKHYHHLGNQFNPQAWQIPTEELDDREDEYVNANIF